MNKYAPRVSVGLPVYNGEQFLAAALDSLLAQTFTDFELIISDNGSTDQTEEICRAYAARDQRIRYYRSTNNHGGAWNFRRAFELSTGEYFRWHSHDDTCAPTLLQACVEVLDRMPAVVLCYPRTTIINEHGQKVQDYNDGLNLREHSAYERYKHYHYRFQDRGHVACNVQFGLMRREVLARTPLLGAYVSSDKNLIGELALRGEFYEVPEHLFFRRDHPQVTIRALPTARERIGWYNPAKKGKRSYPRTRRLFEHLKSVTRVPMRWDEKLRCYLLVGRYVSWQVPKTLKRLRKRAQPLSKALQRR